MSDLCSALMSYGNTVVAVNRMVVTIVTNDDALHVFSTATCRMTITINGAVAFLALWRFSINLSRHDNETDDSSDECY